jgi:serine phosphatase RsbU (regulator of sigma subunit)
MATMLYGLYTPGTGEFVVSSAGHIPPVLAAPGRRAGLLPLRPDPPIGTADDPRRRTATFFVPPGGFLCCFTDGLVERRDRAIDHGIDQIAAILNEQIAARPDARPDAGGAVESPAEHACAAVMRTLVGTAPAQDDIAVLMLSRRRLRG